MSLSLGLTTQSLKNLSKPSVLIQVENSNGVGLSDKIYSYSDLAFPVAIRIKLGLVAYFVLGNLKTICDEPLP